MTQEHIRSLLQGVLHPESGEDIVSAGIAEVNAADGQKITVTLHFPKARDPFALKIKSRVQELLERAYPELAPHITVIVREAAPRKAPDPVPAIAAERIGCILAVASGKGGVGKSTVTANLALSLRNMGYSVGILDADIYGPSQPKMLGVEGYMPEAVQRDGVDLLVPAEAMGVKVISIGFFIQAGDALVWRGPMATNALKQMIHQTDWGRLDFLLVDLPPGTGDVHLSVLSEMSVDGAIIVSTPQQVALADVARGIAMFRAEKIAVPIVGLIENMAWFTPRELPDNRYYIFGRGGARALAEKQGIPLLGQIPIIQSVMEGGETGSPAVLSDPQTEAFYRTVAQEVSRWARAKKAEKEC